jgi:hypothetical protein
MPDALKMFFGRLCEWSEEFFINVCQFAEFAVMWQGEGAPILARIEREEIAAQLEEDRNKICV